MFYLSIAILSESFVSNSAFKEDLNSAFVVTSAASVRPWSYPGPGDMCPVSVRYWIILKYNQILQHSYYSILPQIDAKVKTSDYCQIFLHLI